MNSLPTEAVAFKRLHGGLVVHVGVSEGVFEANNDYADRRLSHASPEWTMRKPLAGWPVKAVRLHSELDRTSKNASSLPMTQSSKVFV